MSTVRDIRPFIKKLCSERFEFDRKDDPADLFAILSENYQLLSTLSNRKWHADDTNGWKNLKINLDKLILFLIYIQKENLSKLNVDNIRARLHILEMVIFPYLAIFPHLSGDTVLFAREVLLLHKDQDWKLNTFLDNLKRVCEEIPLPCTQIKIEPGMAGTHFERDAKAINAFVSTSLSKKQTNEIVNELRFGKKVYPQIDKFTAREMLAIIVDNFDRFYSLAQDEQIFRQRLQDLLDFILQYKHFAKLSQPDIKLHLAHLKKIFPFSRQYWIGKQLLTLVRELSLAYPDLRAECDSIVSNFIAYDHEVEIPKTRVKKIWPWSRHLQTTLVEEKTATEMSQRVTRWDEPVKTLLQQFRSEKPPKFTVERKALETEHKLEKSRRITLTQLWLDLLSQLLDKPDDKYTHTAYSIFCGIYVSLDIGSTDKAIQYALAGIVISTKEQAERLSAFLYTPYESNKPEEYVKSFSLRQFRILYSLPKQHEDFLQFLADHPNHRKAFIEVVKTVPPKPKAVMVATIKAKPVQEVKDEKEFKVVFDLQFIEQLRKSKCDFHQRYQPSDLIVILEKHGETLRLFAQEKMYHNHNENLWVNFNSNLELLLKSVIRPKNLTALSESEVTAHLAAMRNVIFPYIKLFPVLSEELLKLVQDIFASPIHCDKRWQLDTFVNDIIILNPRTSFPFSHITTPLGFTSAEMANVKHAIEPILARREEELCRNQDAQKNRLKHKAEAMKTVFDKWQPELKGHPEPNHPEPACHPERSEGSPDKTPFSSSDPSSQKTLLRMTNLWLTIATRLQTDPLNEETQALCVLFTEIYTHLNHELINNAIQIAFASISLWNNKHKELVKLVYAFLETPTNTTPFTHERRMLFCQRQYDLMYRLEGDLASFKSFLEENPDHCKLFTSMLSASYVTSAPQLQAFSSFAPPPALDVTEESTQEVENDPSTPLVEYDPFGI